MAKKANGVYLPQALVIGLCMYAITSVFAGVWVFSKIETQVDALNELKPVVSNMQERMARMEGSNQAILFLLQDIQARINSRNHAFNNLDISTQTDPLTKISERP